MTWVKLDDGFAGHPKIEEVGPLAAWMFVAGLCHCATYLTDGFIAESKANRLITEGKPGVHIRRLVKVGLWVKVDGGYQVHDYLNYQPSRTKVLVDRDAAAERKRKSREKSRALSQCDIGRDNYDGHAVTHSGSHTTPTRPDPTRVSNYSVSLLLRADGSERDPRVMTALDLAAAKDAKGRTSGDPGSYWNACWTNRAERDGTQLDALADTYPDDPPERLLEILDELADF